MKFTQAAITFTIFNCVSAWSPLQKKQISNLRLNLSVEEIGNNVVLAPSNDEDAFDSLKIGSPRVHRYSREGGEGSEYVMWYHGRNNELNAKGDTPPLSTGRIGKAVSRNGLHWEKDTQGSLSEDKTDVTLGLNKESWWGFDTGHVGLGQVLLPMSLPSVISEGGVYIMYFMGGNYEENSVGDYMPGNVDVGDKTVKGMNMRIGVAMSQDGTTFGRIEGEDPTGAIMVPYSKSMGKVMKGKDSIDIDEELYCAWPDVVPVIGGRDDFLMYYSTMLKDTREKVLAYAVSKNGFTFSKRGISLKPDPDTYDSNGCARCTVVENQVYNESGRWTKANGYTMFYEGVGNDNKHRIMKAESSDGETWTKSGLVLDVGEENSWDVGGVGSPSMIRLDDGTCRIYYTGQGSDGSTAIGVAKLGEDGVWKREQVHLSFQTE